MKLICPKCHQPIPADQINASTDVAFCPQCQEVYSLQKLVGSGQADPEQLGDPPAGCWFIVSPEMWQVGASTRSAAAALFLVPFMCVWSGFSLGGIYGTQIIKGHFNLSMSLFGIPFLLGTLLFGSIALMTACGKIAVTVRGEDAEALVGVGSIGWRRRFRWSDIQEAAEGRPNSSYSGQQSFGIRLVGSSGKVIELGTGLKEERRLFVMRVLRRMLVKK